MQGAVAAVMVHVADAAAGIAWYERAFPDARRESVGQPPFERLAMGDVFIEIVAADSKVSSGASGSVVYWRVADFESALAHFRSVGASLYRGPMTVGSGERMCQLRDPWGNCIGLRGPAPPPGPFVPR
jgi:predicted enzyme related to lactoylglutathione lyase